MATNNENTEIEIKEDEVEIVYGHKSVMKTKLVMETGDSNWWNYIIEYEIKSVYGEAWDVVPFKTHTVFRENRHGIAKCVGKKLIYDSVKNGVRLVDSKYECKEDDGEEDYNGENI